MTKLPVRNLLKPDPRHRGPPHVAKKKQTNHNTRKNGPLPYDQPNHTWPLSLKEHAKERVYKPTTTPSRNRKTHSLMINGKTQQTKNPFLRKPETGMLKYTKQRSPPQKTNITNKTCTQNNMSPTVSVGRFASAHQIITGAWNKEEEEDEMKPTAASRVR